jgi:beta-lactamase regulating signal transducer with metallopeptidase domain
MNLFEALLAKPFFQALGWALIHFIWQGALVAALYATARVMLRRASSDTRYGAACAAMLLMLALPVATLILALPSSTEATGSYNVTPYVSESPSRSQAGSSIGDLSGALWQHPAYSSSAEAKPPLINGSFKQWAESRFNAVMPWLVALWFTGVFFLSVRFLGGLALVQRLKRAQTSPAVRVWQERLDSLREQLRVSRGVRLCESALVEVPTVIGWLRPVILVPASLFTGLSAPQLEALLAHELAHIRRYDYLVNLIQTAVETLLFYHPAVWWVSAQLREEREHCCDDLAVAVCNDVLVYARALAALEQIRSHMPQPAVAANGGSLLKRIQRLVSGPAPLSHGFDSWLAGLIAIATAFSILAGSQTALLSPASSDFESELSASYDTASADAASKSIGNSYSNSAKPHSLSVVPSASAADGESEASEPSPVQTDAATISSEAAAQDGGSGGQDFISEMVAEGYTNLTVEQIIALKTHDITPEFVRGMKGAFGSRLPVDHLIALKVHGATPQFVRELKEAGLDKISDEMVVAFRVHGVTAQFIGEIKELGFDYLSAETFVAFKVHGVTPSFIREVKSLGFNNPSDDEIVALKVHGATPQFMQAMRSYIRDRLSLDQVIAMRVHGVTPEYIKGLEDAGQRDLSADELVAFRVHGVTAEFIKAMQSFGFSKVDADHLVALRVHGVTAEFVQRVKSRGFTDVTIEQLIELKRLNILPSERK